MIAAGIAGFAYAMPLGSIPLILACAMLQGGGFGIAWPFVTRVIVAVADPAESTIASSAVPTMQRIGYAVGAALCGIIANASGFSAWAERRDRGLGRVLAVPGIRAARHSGRRVGHRHRPHGRPPAAVDLDGQSRSLTMVQA